MEKIFSKKGKLMQINWTTNSRSSRGQGMDITYGYRDVVPYGRALIAQTHRGICYFAFPQYGQESAAEQKMRDYFPKANFSKGVVDVTDKIDMHGTAHHIKTWKELIKVKAGESISYQELARRTGDANGARAAGAAMASNPVCLYIPCHRVIAANGNLHNYAWGLDLKEKILKDEQS